MPRSILVVDDEPAVRQVLDHLLSTQGWRVEQSESGSAALARLDATAFDAILCDLDLRSDIDGIELLRRMPAMNHQTPFLLLTGHGSVARCREAFLLGAFYLTGLVRNQVNTKKPRCKNSVARVARKIKRD